MHKKSEKADSDTVSRNCLITAHSKCKGLLRSKHGIRPVCCCPCHRRSRGADKS